MKFVIELGRLAWTKIIKTFFLSPLMVAQNKLECFWLANIFFLVQHFWVKWRKGNTETNTLAYLITASLMV